MTPNSPGSNSKRNLPMAAQRRRVGKRPWRQEPATAPPAGVGGMVVPCAAAVLDVKPINAIPPPPPPPPPAGREEPPCLRSHFLVELGLRADLPVHFIDEKRVTSTDLVAQQNRFRIPSDGVERCLRAILTPAELREANLLGDPTPRSRTRKRRAKRQQPGPLQGETRNGEGERQGEKIMKEPKKKGRVHGGFGLKLVDLAAGAKKLLMSRWSSSKGTIVKGRGYLDFIRRCGFKENDVVEVWAFVERRFRLFGANLCDDGPLHVLVEKKDQQQPGCCYCCPLPHPTHRS
ncbi:hypothetical protein C2845_PM08G21840 [Panicum miliaceum]|uniref:B3 domain-containing protein n=1 Tax=Panicum miliaceum TaxID=4540 RepID=A0A3L6QZ04_PANMI|nr:hypothetical protein C2845_PM08G21840 [Panicum miliaceum]